MQARSEETRRRLLQAALGLFSKSGYEAASVDEICQAAGVSKGAFYHHFPGKQAIFLALLENWLSSVDASLESARQPEVPATLLGMAATLPEILASASGALPMFLEFWLQASRDPAIARAISAPYLRYQQYFAALVEEGIRAGNFKPVESQSAARMIVSLAAGTFLQAMLAPDQARAWGDTIQENIQILLKGLSA